jgi:hypothetical protein
MDALERDKAMREALARLEPQAARFMGLAFAERLVAVAERSTQASLDSEVAQAALDRCWDVLSGEGEHVASIEESLREALPLAEDGTVLARSGAALEFYAIQGLLELLDTKTGSPHAQVVAIQLHSWLNSHLVHVYASSKERPANLLPYASDTTGNVAIVLETSVEDKELVDVIAGSIEWAAFRGRAVTTGKALADIIARWEIIASATRKLGETSP